MLIPSEIQLFKQILYPWFFNVYYDYIEFRPRSGRRSGLVFGLDRRSLDWTRPDQTGPLTTLFVEELPTPPYAKL